MELQIGLHLYLGVDPGKYHLAIGNMAWHLGTD